LGNQTTGIGTGGLFNFDVWTTFDSGAQSAYSALDNVASTFTSGTYSDPWNGTAYDSATVPNSTFSTTTYTMVNWNNSGGSGNGTTWDASSSNWSDGGSSPVAYADGDNVLFTDNNNSHYNVTLNSTVSPGSIIVANSAGNYKISGTGSIAGSTWLTMSGSGTLTLANTGTNTFTGATTVNNGTVVIGAKGALPAGNALYINNSVTTNAADTAYTTATGVVQLAPNTGGETLSALTIAPTSTTSITLTSGTTSVTVNGGTLDITNNHLILNYTTDPNTTILGYLSTGSNGGTWNGPGIISSTAAANSNYGVGYADGADGIDTNLTSGEIEVAYVQYGDITLSGLVNANDFHILTTNFGHVVTGGWEDGDFTYTGTVNANDFHLLTGNFGKTESGEDLSMPASDWAALDAFAAANGLSVSSVPEPATASLTAVMCAALLARRRRRARS
jgi:autotransporter-associated beta strand protein